MCAKRGKLQQWTDNWICNLTFFKLEHNHKVPGVNRIYKHTSGICCNILLWDNYHKTVQQSEAYASVTSDKQTCNG